MAALVHEKVWVDKKLYDDAERQFYESRAKKHKPKNMPPVQSVGNVANTPISPKKSKKNKKDKAKRNASDKEQRSSSEREKEVSVEKCPEPIPVKDSARSEPAPGQANPNQSDKAKDNFDKTKDNSDKTKDNSDKSKETSNQSKDTSNQSKDSSNKSKDNSNRNNGKSDKNKDNSEKKTKCDRSAELVQQDIKVKEGLSVKGGVSEPSGQCSLASEVARARQHIKNSLECMDSVVALAGVPNVDVLNKINSLEKENQDLKKSVEELRRTLQDLKINFESFSSKFSSTATPAPASKAVAAAPAAKGPAPAEDSDDGVDLFGSDDEEESAEAARVREERLAAYNAKKSKKPVLIAKSNIILDVKPWDDETDMAAMEAAVRVVNTDGLLWGAAKLVPLAYGIHKLQISCVVEDDKVSVDWLQEELEKIEDYVQSVDIAAFNKV